MKNYSVVIAAIFCVSGTAYAGGFDGITIGVAPLFEPGNYLEASHHYIKPSISGVDFRGTETGDMIPPMRSDNGALKVGINDQWSFAVLTDQPFQRETDYHAGVAKGLHAWFDSRAWTFLLRYKITPTVSVYGGPFSQELQMYAHQPVQLGGTNYTLTTDPDRKTGYTFGLAYEANRYTRVSLTYRSEVKHELDGYENGIRTTVDQKTPQSIVLEGQIPLSQKLLVYGAVKWADWNSVKIAPDLYVQTFKQPVREYKKDTIRYVIGGGYKLTNYMSLLAGYAYEASNEPKFSALSPTGTAQAGTLGLQFDLGQGFKVTPTYTKIWYEDTSHPIFGKYKNNTLSVYTLKASYSF